MSSTIFLALCRQTHDRSLQYPLLIPYVSSNSFCATHDVSRLETLTTILIWIYLEFDAYSGRNFPVLSSVQTICGFSKPRAVRNMLTMDEAFAFAKTLE
jgi:hypothetical protein